MPKPPMNPEGFDKINFVIDSWTTGCDAPWYIYIETMGPAALKAFIVLITFGWADVLRGALRPKGLGRRTGKRKGHWGKRIPRFPEIGNTLGKALPFAEQVEDFVHWGTTTKNLWRIDNAMQAGLFFWLVADVAEDFAFNWTSLLYETHWCKFPAKGRMSYQNKALATKSSGTWHRQGYTNKDYQIGWPTWLGQIGRTGPNGASVGATITFKKFLGFTAPTSCKVKIQDMDTGTVIEETSSDTPDADGGFRIPVTTNINNDLSFRVFTWHEPTWASVGVGAIFGSEN